MADRRARGPAARKWDATCAAVPGCSAQGLPDREVDVRRHRWAQAVEDGFPVEVVGEPRIVAVTDDDPGTAGLVQQAERLGLVGGRAAADQQGGVDVPTGDRGPVEQPHAGGGQPRQPPPERLGHTGRNVRVLMPGSLREQ